MSFAISAEEIKKVFGRGKKSVEALKRVNLDIEQGELFFLLGGSGCGKTTLLRCIAGLEEPTDGRILFEGDDVTKLPTHKREAAMVFQSYALWPHMTVGENVAFGLEERKVPKAEIKKRVEEALEMVNLAGYGDRGIDQMSGGQQQRVSLARALVVKPKCLLLDEPLSNLDAALRLKMRAEIRRIVKENNLTGVYVTHDQEEALSMADRMAVMDLGEIVQVGSPQDIYQNPKTSYVAGFIGETNLILGTVKALGEMLTVDTWAGTLKGRKTDLAWLPELGQEVKVSIRPEALQVVPGHSAEGILRAKVKESTYLGDMIQYGMELVGAGALGGHQGELIYASEMNPKEVRQPGDYEVRLVVDESDVVILER